MKIKDLKDRLALIPEEYDDLHILMSKDDEGNGYRQFRGIDLHAWLKDEDPEDWEVEFVYEEDELDEDEKEEAIRVAVVY
jgi:hypothetical protein